MGLANRVVEPGRAREEAEKLAEQVTKFPWNCVLSDRQSAYEQMDLDFEQAMRNEFRLGLRTVNSGETKLGAGRFVAGKGRHGSFE